MIGKRLIQVSASSALGEALSVLDNFAAAEAAQQAALAFFQGAGLTRDVNEAREFRCITLARGNLVTAQAHIAPILEGLATVGAQATIETEWNVLTCYHVLMAAGDPHAAAVLDAAYQRLQAATAKLSDEATRHMFLENLPYHREIVAAWQAAQTRTSD